MFNEAHSVPGDPLPPNAPKFLILGAQKAGTTTLFDMLSSVDGFSGSSVKETYFFSKDKFYAQGHEGYLAHFKQAKKDDITFEATPQYLYCDLVPERIFRFNRGMKFVVLLREPAERCFSSWNMYRLFNAQNPQVIYDQYVQHANPASRGAIGELLFAKTFPAFATAVEEDMNRFLEASVMPEPSFVRRGLYYEQVLRYLKYFDLASFLFLETNELSSPPCVLGKIGKFLNLDIDPASMSAKKSNPGVYDGVPPDAEEILRRLKIFYAPHNEKLFKLIGQRYPWNES